MTSHGLRAIGDGDIRRPSIGYRLSSIVLPLFLLPSLLLARVPDEFLASEWPESLNLWVVGWWNRGPVQAVEYHNGWTWCGTGRSLLAVLDSATMVRTEIPGIAQDLLIDGNRLFVAGGRAGLLVFALDQSGQVSLLSGSGMPGYAWSLSKDGDLLLLNLGTGGIRVIDVQQPESPRTVSSLTPAESVNAVCLRNGFAYLACGREGLLVLDAHRPDNLFLIARLATPGPARGVTLRDTFAFIACGDSDELVASIAHPDRPRPLARHSWPGALTTAVRDTVAAIAAGPNGVFLANVRFPDAAFLYAHLPLPGGYAQDACFQGDTLTIAGGPAGLFRFNIANPWFPVLLSRTPQPGYILDAMIADSIAWVGASTGLYGVRLSSGPNSDKGFCQLPRPASGLALASGTLAVAQADLGLGFVDIRDARHSMLRRMLALSGAVTALAAQDSWVWAGTADSALQIVSVANPDTPRVVNRIPLGYRVAALASEGGLLRVASPDFGVSFWSIASPGAPGFLGAIPLPGGAAAVAGRTSLTVAASDRSLYLIDARTPTLPIILSRLPLSCRGRDVALDDTLCYVAEDIGGIAAVSVANSFYPWTTAYYAAPGRVRAVVVDRHRPIAVDAYAGLLELEFRFEPAAVPPTFSGVPDVARSSIAVLPGFRVRVPASQSQTSVELFDPSGRRLMQKTLAAGSAGQEVVLEAEPVGAGVYFIRYRNQNRTTTLKTLFVR
jgi:hypothetical protein